MIGGAATGSKVTTCGVDALEMRIDVDSRVDHFAVQDSAEVLSIRMMT